MPETTPLTDPQSIVVEAGRLRLRARFAGGAFPAALGQAIADELADVAMAPLLADNARLRATPACTCRAEPVHQAGCETAS